MNFATVWIYFLLYPIVKTESVDYMATCGWQQIPQTQSAVPTQAYPSELLAPERTKENTVTEPTA